MGWSSTSDQITAQRMLTQTRSAQWIILCLFIISINTKQSYAEVKELTGKCKCRIALKFEMFANVL